MASMIYLGADHGGFMLKESIKKAWQKKKLKFVDLSPIYQDGDDYPDIAKKVARAVKKDKKSKGVLICGSGTGMEIAANRYKGIRAAFPHDRYEARYARKDNDANILCLRARKFPVKKSLKILSVFFGTAFSHAARHKRRIHKLDAR